VPGPGEARLIRPGWNGGAGPPRRLGFPVPVRRCVRCAEARRLRCPGGVGCRRPRRAAGSLSRGTGWPVLRRVPVARSRGRVACAPKRAACRSRWEGSLRAEARRLPFPVERGRPCSEERGVPCPGEVRRTVPREAPRTEPRWVGALPRSRSGGSGRLEPGAAPPRRLGLRVPVRPGAWCAEARRLPDPGEVRRAMLRRAPCASPRVERSRSPSEEAGRPCPGWNWLGGAPKRAVCPAPWNWLGGAPKRAVCPAPVAGSPYPEGRGTGVRGRGFNAVMLRSAEADPHVTEHTARAGAEAPVFAT